MPRTTVTIKEEIEKLQIELEKLERQEAMLAALPFNQRLAIVMHNTKCTADHTEHCGWFYEIKDGKHQFLANSTHSAWLRRAETYISRIYAIVGNSMSEEDIIEIAKISGY